MAWAYFLKRVLLAAFTLLVILFLSYLLLRLAPGDPTRASLFGGEGQGVSSSDKGAFVRNEALRRELGLDRGIAEGFYRWLDGVVRRGDLGRSATVEPGKPVAELILERLPVTLELNLLALAVCYCAAIPLGVGAAVWRDRWFDRVTSVGLFLLYSLPVMWVGILLQSCFAEGGVWGWFPLQGVATEHAEMSTFEAMGETLRGYFLPVVCLSYGGVAGLSRYTRASMLEVMNCDFIRSARAKGVPEPAVIWTHAFRNSLIPLITLFSGLLPGLIAGSIIVEYLFNIPGMGTLSLLALSSRDYPLQMALFSFASVLTLCGIFLADMLYLAADPRISLK